MIYKLDLWMREIRIMEKIDHVAIVVTNIKPNKYGSTITEAIAPKACSNI